MPTSFLEKPPSDEPRVKDSTGATLAGFRNAGELVPSAGVVRPPAEDMLIPGVEDVVEESVSGHHPAESDPIADHTMVLNMGPQHPLDSRCAASGD